MEIAVDGVIDTVKCANFTQCIDTDYGNYSLHSLFPRLCIP